MRPDVIAIGGSAGAVEAVKVIIAALPADFSAAILVTLHIGPHASSMLAELLELSGALPAEAACEGQSLRLGHVLVAPPDRHLMVVDGVVSLSRGARENGSRPAIDPMFRSVARAYGRRVVGVLLSGTLDDGAAGLALVKARGGTTIAQSLGTALFPDMPRNAIEMGVVEHVLPLPEIAPWLVELVGTRSGHAGEALRATTPIAEALPANERTLVPGGTAPDEPANTYSCPDCGGVLQLVRELGGAPHFRCMVGHAWSAHSLLSAQLTSIEESLWAAVRALEEHRKLTVRLLSDARRMGSLMTTRYEDRLRDIEINAARIRSVLLNPLPGDETPSGDGGAGRDQSVS